MPETPVPIGPLLPSAGLARVLAACELLRRELPQRSAELGASPRSFGLEELTALETELAVVFPNDVLVLAGLRITALEHACGVRFESLAGNHSTYASGWTTIASAEMGDMDPELEWSPTDQGVHALDVCISNRAARDEEPKVRLYDEQEPETPRTKSLSSFLAERLALRYPEEWPAAWRRAAKTPPPAEWSVAIEDDRPPPLAIPVSHPKFGPGTIVKELDGGKVEVKFASGTSKTLLRSFLRTEE